METQTLHKITIENKTKTQITDVVEVKSATEKVVVLLLSKGAMQITGENLHINKLSIEEKVLLLDGTVTELKYTEKTKTKSFFKKLFK